MRALVQMPLVPRRRSEQPSAASSFARAAADGFVEVDSITDIGTFVDSDASDDGEADPPSSRGKWSSGLRDMVRRRVSSRDSVGASGGGAKSPATRSPRSSSPSAVVVRARPPAPPPRRLTFDGDGGGGGAAAAAADDSSSSDDEVDDERYAAQLAQLHAEDEELQREAEEATLSPAERQARATKAARAVRPPESVHKKESVSPPQPRLSRSESAARDAAFIARWHSSHSSKAKGAPSGSAGSGALVPRPSRLGKQRAPSDDTVVSAVLPDTFDLPREFPEPFAERQRMPRIYAARAHAAKGGASNGASTDPLSYQHLLQEAFCGDTLSTVCSLVGLRRFHVMSLVCTAWHDAIVAKMREWGVLTYVRAIGKGFGKLPGYLDMPSAPPERAIEPPQRSSCPSHISAPP